MCDYVWRLVWCPIVWWISTIILGEPGASIVRCLSTKLHSIASWQAWIITVSIVILLNLTWLSSLSAVVCTIRRPTASPLQLSPKCSRCWSMPANTCTQTTWLSLWPTQTRNRNCVKVTVVGVTYEITSSALIWLAWEGSIRWVSTWWASCDDLSASSGTDDTHLTVGGAVAPCECWVWCCF